MSYRGMGQSGEVDTETYGWLHGNDVTGSDSPGYSTIIPYGSKDGVMTGGMPTREQIAAGMPGSGFDLSAWVKANSSTVYLAAGAFVLMAMFGGRRR